MPDNKSLSTEFGSKPELKKYMKKLMPFVQMAKEKLSQHGIQAINLTMDFDEMEIIKKNIKYLSYTLDVCFYKLLFFFFVLEFYLFHVTNFV